MNTTVIRQVGPGEEFETLAAWARALPRDLAALNQCQVAELTALGDDPGGVVIQSVCDTECYVEIRASAGYGFAALTDPVTDPVAPGVGLGATVRCNSGDAIRVVGGATRVHLSGLRVIAEDGAALVDDGAGSFAQVEGCLIEAVSLAPAVTMRGTSSEIRATGIVQRGFGDGLLLADGASADAITLLKPVAMIADGTGVCSDGAGQSIIAGSAVFGFRQAFGNDLVLGPGLACDQNNQLDAPEDFARTAWTPFGASLDLMQTLPGPFAPPLHWLTNNQNAHARFEHTRPLTVRPGQRISFSALVAEPTAFSTALCIHSPAGEAALRVDWMDHPTSTALSGHDGGLVPQDGGLTRLGGGCYRLWLVAENLTQAVLSVRPALHVTAGIENAGLNLGLFAGCLMAGTGHTGTGYVRASETEGVDHPGIDPTAALRGTTSMLPDLRPIDSGELDVSAPCQGSDLLGRHRLNPETPGALTLNPAPRVVGDLLQRAPMGRRTTTATEARL
ncbi:MAG: hypothetical protein AB8B85_21380 [Paracoccaceae bacterium]